MDMVIICEKLSPGEVLILTRDENGCYEYVANVKGKAVYGVACPDDS